MRLIRSWPAQVPDGHPRVIDKIETVKTDGPDYWPLAELGDDLIHLDWDIAVDPEGLAIFAARAAANPGSVLVAPYRLYPGSMKGAGLRAGHTSPVWAARRYDGGAAGAETSMREIEPSDTHCHVFGFGMVYLPAALLTRFCTELPAEPMTDMAFSGWHNRNVAYDAELCWEAAPVHLNWPRPVLDDEGGLYLNPQGEW